MFSTDPAVGRAVAVAPCRPHTSASPHPRPSYTPPCGPVAITTDTPRSGTPHPTTDARTTSPATSTARAAHPRRRVMPTPSKDTPNPASMPPPSVAREASWATHEIPACRRSAAAQAALTLGTAGPTAPPTTRSPHESPGTRAAVEQAQGFTNTLAAGPTRSRHSRYRHRRYLAESEGNLSIEDRTPTPAPRKSPNVRYRPRGISFLVQSPHCPGPLIGPDSGTRTGRKERTRTMSTTRTQHPGEQESGRSNPAVAAVLVVFLPLAWLLEACTARPTPTLIVMDDFESGSVAPWQAVGGGAGGLFVYSDGDSRGSRAQRPRRSFPSSPSAARQVRGRDRHEWSGNPYPVPGSSTGWPVQDRPDRVLVGHQPIEQPTHPRLSRRRGERAVPDRPHRSHRTHRLGGGHRCADHHLRHLPDRSS